VQKKKGRKNTLDKLERIYIKKKQRRSNKATKELDDWTKKGFNICQITLILAFLCRLLGRIENQVSEV